MCREKIRSFFFGKKPSHHNSKHLTLRHFGEMNLRLGSFGPELVFQAIKKGFFFVQHSEAIFACYGGHAHFSLFSRFFSFSANF
jgi:hypothetical protein